MIGTTASSSAEIVVGIPWNFGQFGSNTSFTMTRTNFVARDALQKVLEIATIQFGGSPSFDIANETVFLKKDPSIFLVTLTLQQQQLSLAANFPDKALRKTLTL